MRTIAALALTMAMVCVAHAGPTATGGSRCVADSTTLAIRAAATIETYILDGRITSPREAGEERLARTRANANAPTMLFPLPGTDAGYIGQLATAGLSEVNRKRLTEMVTNEAAYHCGPADATECIFTPHYGIVFRSPPSAVLILISSDCREVSVRTLQGLGLGGGHLSKEVAAEWARVLKDITGS